nr:uncharacterized protein LOC113804576 [Penaeus vannamei]
MIENRSNTSLVLSQPTATIAVTTATAVTTTTIAVTTTATIFYHTHHRSHHTTIAVNAPPHHSSSTTTTQSPTTTIAVPPPLPSSSPTTHRSHHHHAHHPFTTIYLTAISSSTHGLPSSTSQVIAGYLGLMAFVKRKQIEFSRNEGLLVQKTHPSSLMKADSPLLTLGNSTSVSSDPESFITPAECLVNQTSNL